MTNPEESTPIAGNIQPSIPDLSIITSFDPGSRALYSRLMKTLELQKARHSRAYRDWSKRDFSFAHVGNRLLEDINRSITPDSNTPFSDNTRFIELLEKLGTPEAIYLARQLRRQKELAHSALKKGGVAVKTAISRQIMRAGTEELKSGEEMPFPDPLPALRLLLEQEPSYFAPKDRQDFLHRLDALQGPATACHNLKSRLDAIGKTLTPVFTLLDRLDWLETLYRILDDAIQRVKRFENELKGVESELQASNKADERGKPGTTHPTHDMRLKELEQRLSSEKEGLAKNEVVIKSLFAENPHLIPAITAILKEIQFLCGDLVKIEIEEITGWEIDLAERRWPKIGGNLPKNSLLTAINPAFIEEAFTFLKEHEDLLKAYDQAKKAREVVAGIEKEIAVGKEHLATIEKDAEVRARELVAEYNNERARLAKSVEEEKDRVKAVAEKVVIELEKLKGDARIAEPLEKIGTERFWTDVENGLCGDILLNEEKELNEIEASIHQLDRELTKQG